MTDWRNYDANDVEREFGADQVKEDFDARTTPLIKPGSLGSGGNSTEETLAREWVHVFRHDWRYDHGTGCWLHWDGTRWRKDETRLAAELMRRWLREAALAEKRQLGNARILRGIETFAQIDQRVAVVHDVWDADPSLLQTTAGIVDLRTSVRRGPDRSAMLTKSTTTAPADGVPERWLQFMGDITCGDEKLAHFLQLALGYCLTGSTREHALFFGFGGGKNGKSVLLNTVSRIMGDYATTAAMDTFTASRGDKHPTDLARLDGARLVAASETEEGRAWAESRIKQLTGGDRIAARFMRKDFFEFTPRFKLFIVGNFRPRLHNVDEATRRRFNIIPFLHTPAHPDKDLEEKLAAEHPQILAWMIEGARLWYVDGLPRPQAIADATDRYFEDQDLVGQWIAERCDVRSGAMGRATLLFESWRDFARENGEVEGTQRSFAEALGKRGFERDRINSLGRIYRGIDVRQTRRSQNGDL